MNRQMHKNNYQKPKINSQNPKVTLNGFVHPTKEAFPFMARNAELWPARVADKVFIFWPEIWILRHETKKIGFARVADKVSNFDLKHWFKARSAKFTSARVADKVLNFWPKIWILGRETEKLRPPEWRTKCLFLTLNIDLRHETQIWVHAGGG